MSPRPPLAVLLLALLTACADDGGNDPLPGHEGGSCEGGRCLQGLTCASNLCVDLDGGTAGDDGDPPADGDDDDGMADDGDDGMADDGDDDMADAADDGMADAGDDGMADAADDGMADAGDDAADDGDCAPPACSSYATKMQSCYPMLDIDWYAECLDVFDICDIGGFCADRTPAIISCSISMPCDAVVDGACLDGDSC